MSGSLRLSIRRGDQEVASALAGELPQKIGRSKQCDVVLEDPAVSRVHAILSMEGARTILTDQGSQNGLWVQGNRVARVVLDPSTVVAMGPFRIVCEALVADRSEDVARHPISTPSIPASAPTPSRDAFREPPAAPAAAPSPSMTERTRAVVPLTSAGEPAAPPPAAAKKDTMVKTAAAPSVKPEPVRLPPPPQRPRALPTASTGGSRGTMLLVAAALIMIVIGGSASVLFLKWRRAEVDGDGRGLNRDPSGTVSTTSASVPPATSAPATGAATSSTSASASLANGVATASSPGDAALVSPAPNPTKPETPATAASSSAPAVTSARPAANDMPGPNIVPAGKRPRESRAAWIRRSTELTTRLNQGKAAIDRGDFAAAIDILTGVQRDEPNFGDTSAQLARAREGQTSNAQARAQAAFDEGQQKDRQQDFSGAIQSYQQAEKIDPEFASRSAAAIAAARTKQKTLVDELLRQANVDFAFKRPAAIPAYQRILKLLSDDDARRREVQAKLNQLLGIKQ